MLISVHILVGSAAGSFFANPVTAFSAGALTHFIGDRLPHWEYSIAALDTLKAERGFAKLGAARRPDAARTLTVIGLEIVGAFLAVWLAGSGGAGRLSAALWGGIGALLPDILWGLADNSNSRLLKAYRAFHHRLHTKARGVSKRFGLSWQIIAAAAAIFVLRR